MHVSLALCRASGLTSQTVIGTVLTKIAARSVLSSSFTCYFLLTAKVSARRSISTEELKPKNQGGSSSCRPSQAEYDYLVKLRVQKANRALINSQSSSSDDTLAPPTISEWLPYHHVARNVFYGYDILSMSYWCSSS